MIPLIIAVVVCLLFPAFFTGTGEAYSASNKLLLEIEKKKHPLFDKIVSRVLKSPAQYNSTVLFGKTAFLVLYVLFTVRLIYVIFFAWNISVTGIWFYVTLAVIPALLYILVAEYLPRIAVRENPHKWMRIFSPLFFLFYIILWPFVKICVLISVGISRLMGMRTKDYNSKGIDRAELESLVDEAAESEDETMENEIKLFQNAMDFTELRVRDCMVPRIEIEAVEISESIDLLTSRFVETNYSRIFIYRDTIDNIIGYVNNKSLFTHPDAIKDILTEVDFVPESLPAQKLLSLLIRNNRYIAVVVDEFGGTAGVASMEDVLEEIFGEIEDEHDKPELVEKIEREGVYLLSGRLEIDYINEKYGVDIPSSEEYDTLAGYVIYMHQGIPRQGETLRIGDKNIKIIKADSSKIELVRVSVV